MHSFFSVKSKKENFSLEVLTELTDEVQELKTENRRLVEENEWKDEQLEAAGRVCYEMNWRLNAMMGG
jgi:HPt (histidine-containing phosphotransfer) domain-containing protein